jgi:hypothetical protein
MGHQGVPSHLKRHAPVGRRGGANCGCDTGHAKIVCVLRHAIRL